ncbi:phage tail terminator-like protein [Paracoccus sp. Arc7-R13]|uniref:phage tail terminator-like protein n=1 Tax=Paracoccus sp. Arc7-R13 TaxID=2500532 RepID=UPI0013E34DA0|nr:phage tail terminator-like protein [Paracoccus sp. Arc7-R13]
MKPSAIQHAIGRRLAAIPGAPVIVVPNETTTAPAVPYLILQPRSRADLDPTLAGSDGYTEGSTIVMVVVALNSRTTAADDLAAKIKAAFPKAARFEGVTVRQSSVLTGYPDAVSWRVPVQIDWIA